MYKKHKPEVVQVQPGRSLNPIKCFKGGRREEGGRGGEGGGPPSPTHIMSFVIFHFIHPSKG
jgi:hypothetical protein